MAKSELRQLAELAMKKHKALVALQEFGQACA